MAKKKEPKDVKFFTVKDLKELLEDMNDGMPVGQVGRFGEFCPMDKDSFIQQEAMVGDASGLWGWRRICEKGSRKNVLTIKSPDIG
jgi:hypothetical protein